MSTSAFDALPLRTGATDMPRLEHVTCVLTSLASDGRRVVLSGSGRDVEATITVDRERLLARADKLMKSTVMATVVISESGWRLVSCRTIAEFEAWRANLGIGVTPEQTVSEWIGVVRGMDGK